MTTRPYELLARFDQSGHVAGASVRTITTVGGKDYESDPMPLSGVDDPAFVEFAQQFAAGAVASRDAAETALAETSEALRTVENERNGALILVDSLREQVGGIAELQSQNATLQAEVERLTALIPATTEDYMITPAAFLQRLQAASPGIVRRILKSDHDFAAEATATLFTWTDLIDCRPGGRIEEFLAGLSQLELISVEEIGKVWV